MTRVDPALAAEWVRRWDTQQQTYADHSDYRLQIVVDHVRNVLADRIQPVVVDLGAGPGSLTIRVARLFPQARVVGLESDPFLVALGRCVFDGDIELVVGDACVPGWRERVGLPHVNAVLASSMLHYPGDTVLQRLYNDILAWLTPKGVLINADHFSDLEPDATEGVAATAPDGGAGPWTQWWSDALASEQLTSLTSMHVDLPDECRNPLGGNALSTSEHIGMLEEVGFARAELVWQRGRSGVIVATKSPTSS